MKLLAYLAAIFIDTFGITRPQPEQERQVHIILGGFLLFFGVVVLGVLGFLVFQIAGSHGR